MTPPRPRQRRWPWYLLVASLAGNMLLGGAMVAHIVHRPPPPGGPMRDIERFVDRATRELSPADGELLRKAFVEERPSLERMRDVIDGMRAALQAGLLAPRFDGDALLATFDKAHEEENEVRHRLDRKMVEVLSRMSDEGRHKLAEFGQGPR